jgi:hypothetical protein
MDRTEISRQLPNFAADAARLLQRHLASGAHPHTVNDLQRIAEMLSTLSIRCSEAVADQR